MSRSSISSPPVGRHRLLSTRPALAIIAFLALIFTALPAVQAHAAPPTAGTYEGTSTAYNGATVSFDVDANGMMSNFVTESYCTDGLFTHPVQWTGMPPTQIEAGEPFNLRWEYGTESVRSYYELTGTVNADGSANGTGRAGFLPSGTCGGMNFTWTAERVGGDPDPEPEIVEAAEPAFGDNTITIPEIEGVSYVDGDGNVLTGTITLAEGESLTVTAVAEEGYELAPGTHTWTFEYEPADPEPEVVTAVEPERHGNTITIPTVEGVTYVDANGDVLTGDIELVEGQTLFVTAVAEEGYELAPGATEWTYTYESGDPEPIEVTAEEPTRVDNTVTIPVVEGVQYRNADGDVLTGDIELVEGQTLVVTAVAEEGYELADGPAQWSYTYESSDPELIEVTAAEPERDGNTITIPVVEGVTYVDAEGVVLEGEITLVEGATLTVTATADEGYVLADGATEWEYTYESTDPDPEVVEAEEPGRDGNTITLPEIEGVYYVDGDGNVLTGTIELVEGQTITISAVAEDGYVLADGPTSWTFEYASSDDDDNDADSDGGSDNEGSGDSNGAGGSGGSDGSSRGGSDGDQGAAKGKDGDLADTGAAGSGLAAALAALLIAAGAAFALVRRRSAAG